MENNEKEQKGFEKIRFFTKIIYSISKFEKYPEMATLGIKKALAYLAVLVLINSILFTGAYIYYIQNRAGFEEKLTLSEKITQILIRNTEMDEEQAEIITQNFSNQNSTILIISMGIVSLYMTTLIDALTLSFFGMITCFIIKIKIKYKALFNMSIYALTLASILRIIYLVVTNLTSFKIKYFDIMYVAISYISLAAAIFIIKSNLIKHQMQLIKIMEESKDTIQETLTIEKKNEKEKKDTEEEKKEKKDEEENENKEGEAEEQSSNA